MSSYVPTAKTTATSTLSAVAGAVLTWLATSFGYVPEADDYDDSVRVSARVVRGLERQLDAEVRPCPTCEARGELSCPACAGAGWVVVREEDDEPTDDRREAVPTRRGFD